MSKRHCLRSNPEPQIERDFSFPIPSDWATNSEQRAGLRALEHPNHGQLLAEIRTVGTEQFANRYTLSARHLLQLVCIRTFQDPTHARLLRKVRVLGRGLCRARHELQAKFLLDEIAFDLRNTGRITQTKCFVAYRAVKTVLTALTHHLLRIRHTSDPSVVFTESVRQEALRAVIIRGESIREFRWRIIEAISNAGSIYGADGEGLPLFSKQVNYDFFQGPIFLSDQTWNITNFWGEDAKLDGSCSGSPQ